MLYYLCWYRWSDDFVNNKLIVQPPVAWTRESMNTFPSLLWPGGRHLYPRLSFLV